MATIDSYSRWTTSGKPVLWAEAGYIYSSTDPQEPIPPRPADQAECFSRFISSMLSTNANGVQFWWWPGGIQQHAGKDFGVTDPDGKPRLAALTMKQWAGQAKKPRPIPTAQEKGVVDIMDDPRGFAAIFEFQRPYALAAALAGKRYVMEGVGFGTTSEQAPEYSNGLPKYLWAEITKVELKVGRSGKWFEVRDGMAYAVPANTKIYVRAEVVNMGDTTWLTNVGFAGNEDKGLSFPPQLLTALVMRMAAITIPPFVITDGLAADAPVQFQMKATGDSWSSWMTGSVKIHLAVYQ